MHNKLTRNFAKKINPQENYTCNVPVVDTLNNRIDSGFFSPTGIGLFIIDYLNHLLLS